MSILSSNFNYIFVFIWKISTLLSVVARKRQDINKYKNYSCFGCYLFCLVFVFVADLCDRPSAGRTSSSRATRWRAASPRASPTPPSGAPWSTRAPRPRASASTCRSPSRPSSPTSPCEHHSRGSSHSGGGGGGEDLLRF